MKKIYMAVLLVLAGSVSFAQESAQAKWDKLSAEQQKSVLAAYEKWKAEPKQRQELLAENYRRFAAMSAEQRAEIVRRWEKYKALPANEKQAIVSKYNKWKDLSQERKDELRRKYSRDREAPSRDGRFSRDDRRSERGGGRR
ncbi:MAG TPA: DUF3106 domain-containing protein [Elusimicrobiales bacterium]|nr:DUF3106 domain-containing protein [Elusimicrobiales bacterium]